MTLDELISNFEKSCERLEDEQHLFLSNQDLYLGLVRDLNVLQIIKQQQKTIELLEARIDDLESYVRSETRDRSYE